MRKIIVAKSAGFCYGVRRAVEVAHETAEKGESVMLGPVIHNMEVVNELSEKGMHLAASVTQVSPESTVLIRSHGEGKPIFDALSEKNCTIINATCPNVLKIHKIVSTAEENGRIPIIVGTHDHPEIIAIAGWAKHAVVVSDAQELENWLEEAKSRKVLPLSFVSQTTSTQKIWHECVKKAKKECTNAEFFDTICGATFTRQEEAQKLASQCDAMIVVGDKQSSNTKRLFELCCKICPHVQYIQRADDLNLAALSTFETVGITAGASTPEWIIKEVCDKMSDEIMEIEESFAELLEKSIKTLNTGDKVVGVITGIAPNEIYVDLGTKHAGYIPLSEFTDDPTLKIEDVVKVGDEIETIAVRINDQEGVVTLSKKRLDAIKGWEEVAAACESEAVVEGIVTEENRGGVVVSVKGVRVFVPASQTGLAREASMSELLKKKVRLIITEVNSARRRVVGSINRVSRAERAAQAEKVWADIAQDKHYTGTVKSLTSYGAFVDIGGVDGMVHISELSWSRIKHPSEVVKVGDVVEVFVLSADKEKKKISLGMKDHSQDPWAMLHAKYEKGDVADVRIVKLMTFGAFAEIVPGVDGLIHISQIADRRIENPAEVLSEGQTVQAKITEIDEENKKVSLSIRALLEPEQAEETDAPDAESEDAAE